MRMYMSGETAFNAREIMDSFDVGRQIFGISDKDGPPTGADDFANYKIAGFVRKFFWVVVYPIAVIFTGITGPDN